MGILNATPDSFFAESRVQDDHAATQRMLDMVALEGLPSMRRRR